MRNKLIEKKKNLEAEIKELEEIIYQHKVEVLNDLVADKKKELNQVVKDLILVDELIANM